MRSFKGNLSEGINFVEFVLIDYSANTTAPWGSISGIATAGPAGHIPYQLALVPHQLASASSLHRWWGVASCIAEGATSVHCTHFLCKYAA